MVSPVAPSFQFIFTSGPPQPNFSRAAAHAPNRSMNRNAPFPSFFFTLRMRMDGRTCKASHLHQGGGVAPSAANSRTAWSTTFCLLSFGCFPHGSKDCRTLSTPTLTALHGFEVGVANLAEALVLRLLQVRVLVQRGRLVHILRRCVGPSVGRAASHFKRKLEGGALRTLGLVGEQRPAVPACAAPRCLSGSC